jgi:ribosomal protein L37E
MLRLVMWRIKPFWGVLSVFILLSPYFVALGAFEYLPGMDESWQLEAAMNLFLGRGYVASWTLPQDIFALQYSYLNAWPPAYSALVTLLLILGFNLSSAAVILKLTAIAFACYGWFLVVRSLNPDKRVVAAAMPAIAVFAVLCSGSASDLWVLAISSYIFLLVTRILAVEPACVVPYKWFMAVGFLCGFAMAMKYTAIPMVAFAGIALTYQWYKSRWMWGQAIAFAVPVLVLGGGVLFANYWFASSVSTITEMSVAGHFVFFKWSWFLGSLQAFFVDALYLPRVFFRAAAGHTSFVSETTFRILSSFFAMGASFAFLIKMQHAAQRQKMFVALTLVAIMLTFAFLWLTTVLYFSESKWYPLSEGRYYQWIIPGFLICLLLSVEPSWNSSRFIHKYFSAVMVWWLYYLAALCVVAFFSSHVYKTGKMTQNDAKEAYQVLLQLRGDANLLIIADEESFRASPLRGQYNVYPDRPAVLIGKRVSHATQIGLICTRSGSWSLHAQKNECETAGFEEFAASRSFQQASIGRRTNIYWKLYAAGSFVETQ